VERPQRIARTTDLDAVETRDKMSIGELGSDHAARLLKLGSGSGRACGSAIDHPDIRESASHIMVSPESAFDYGRASRARNYHEDPSEIDARPLHTSGDPGHERPHEP
jgi:hypothetical protein